MDNFKALKYKSKPLKNNIFKLENDFKPINTLINYIGKFDNKRTNKKENFYEKHLA